jgi:hypothetical protein
MPSFTRNSNCGCARVLVCVSILPAAIELYHSNTTLYAKTEADSNI